jgi:hypothetical protein
LAEVVEGDDVGVVQGRSGAGILEQAPVPFEVAARAAGLRLTRY